MKKIIIFVVYTYYSLAILYIGKLFCCILNLVFKIIFENKHVGISFRWQATQTYNLIQLLNELRDVTVVIHHLVSFLHELSWRLQTS